ncbi:MAG: cyclic pyranopterin monophosphate synthase MoaC [Actinomycetia bacterium]|nr:cyclic pyranopterin monophosphate synthase MoaC [Actinomycetes bacterium]
MEDLTHVDAAGAVRMVDVAAKPVSARVAVAEGVVACSPEALRALSEGRLPKGDGLAVARVAGILAAKRTAELIPLCHPLALEAVDVALAVEDVVRIRASVSLHARTGAEMEALTAVAVAGLTVIDMVKALDRGASLRDVRVAAKSGGASGGWESGSRVVALPPAGVVTVSDRRARSAAPAMANVADLGAGACAPGLACSQPVPPAGADGTARPIHAHGQARSAAPAVGDVSGPLVAAALTRAGAASVTTRVVPDDVAAIREVVSELVAAGCRIVITTGGTGLAPRDVTPEALAPLLKWTIPGLAEGLRAAGAAHTATAALSRSVAGVLEDEGARALVVALPGSVGGVTDAMAYLGPLWAHIVDQLGGGDHPADAPDVTGAAAAVPRDVADPRVLRAEVGPAPIDAAALEASVHRASAGAVVTFTGVVRDHDGGRDVASLTYEAHPDASAELRRLCQDVLSRHPQVSSVAAVHRTGALRVGDVAFAAAVACAHRREAFAACGDLVDAVKAGVPIWKRERFADGTDEWVGA